MLSKYMKPVRLNLYGCNLRDAEAHVTSMLSGYKQGGGWSMLRLFAAERCAKGTASWFGLRRTAGKLPRPVSPP